MTFDPLRTAFHRLAPLSDAAWAPVPALVTVREVAAGTPLLRAGDIARDVVFVRRGLLREFYVGRDGRETTRRFTPAGDFSGSLADLLAGGPAMVWIEALEAGEVWCVPWAALDALSREHADWMRLARAFAERLYVRKMQREFEFLTLSASERYAAFAQAHPALAERLPRHLVASYLGITPVHLSRIARVRTPTPRRAAPAGRT